MLRSIRRLFLLPPPKTNSQSGQIAVIVLLIMVVILGVAVQMAQQTAEDAQVSVENTETTRVFNAAESAAEEALAQLESGKNAEEVNTFFDESNPESQDFRNQFLNQKSEANQDQTNISALVSEETNFDSFVPVGTSITLDPDAGGGQIDIYWDRQGVAGASLLLTLIVENGSRIDAQYVAYGSAQVTHPDNISQGTAGSYDRGGNTYTSAVENFSYPAGTRQIRIMPLYQNTHLFIEGLSNTQSHIIRGNASDIASNESRTIELVRGMKAAPSFMDYAVFSGGSLQK